MKPLSSYFSYFVLFTWLFGSKNCQKNCFRVLSIGVFTCDSALVLASLTSKDKLTVRVARNHVFLYLVVLCRCRWVVISVQF